MRQTGPSGRKAIITGITGQDGSYLAEFLLQKGYEVHAIIRRASTLNTSRIDHVFADPHENPPLKLYYGDITDSGQVANLIHKIGPDEVYHLGAQSHVKVSFDLPEYTSDVTGIGTTRILEAVRQGGLKSKIYQASSSEMFGSAPPPQNEETQFQPRSPYACSKVYAYWMVKNYREGYGMWCCNGIMFNHESPRRGPTFVTRKIAAGVASIVAKEQEFLYLGNLDAKRDWGYAPEYVELMWKMLQQGDPFDYVVGTGVVHSVREFVEEAFSYAGLDSNSHVRVDKGYFRPTEADYLCADSRRIRKDLGWQPKVGFKDLVHIMVDSEMRDRGLQPVGEGDSALDRTYPNRWWNDRAKRSSPVRSEKAVPEHRAS